MWSDFCDNTDQTASGKNVAVLFDTVFASLINYKITEPVRAIIGNDMRSDLLIIRVVFIQFV